MIGKQEMERWTPIVEGVKSRWTWEELWEKIVERWGRDVSVVVGKDGKTMKVKIESGEEIEDKWDVKGNFIDKDHDISEDEILKTLCNEVYNRGVLKKEKKKKKRS